MSNLRRSIPLQLIEGAIILLYLSGDLYLHFGQYMLYIEHKIVIRVGRFNRLMLWLT